MKLKTARTGFVCAFTALFAFIAMMGEGLHLLPGMGHSLLSSRLHWYLPHRPPNWIAVATVVLPPSRMRSQNPGAINNAAVLSGVHVFIDGQILPIDAICGLRLLCPSSSDLVVCSPLLQSRYVCSYHISRSSLRHVASLVVHHRDATFLYLIAEFTSNRRITICSDAMHLHWSNCLLSSPSSAS